MTIAIIKRQCPHMQRLPIPGMEDKPGLHIAIRRDMPTSDATSVRFVRGRQKTRSVDAINTINGFTPLGKGQLSAGAAQRSFTTTKTSFQTTKTPLTRGVRSRGTRGVGAHAHPGGRTRAYNTTVAPGRGRGARGARGGHFPKHK